MKNDSESQGRSREDELRARHERRSRDLGMAPKPSSPPVGPPPRRRAPLAAALIVVGVALLVAAGVFAWRGLGARSRAGTRVASPGRAKLMQALARSGGRDAKALVRQAAKGLQAKRVNARTDLPRSFSVADRMTPVKDLFAVGQHEDFDRAQDAFAIVQAVEGELIFGGGPPMDLSEQEILASSNRPVTMLFPIDYGLVTEKRLPYKPGGPPIDPDSLSPDVRANELFVVGGGVDCSEAAMKTALLQYGPSLATMEVYEDLQAYDGTGVYQHRSGEDLDCLSILLVGWDDARGAWEALAPGLPSLGAQGHLWLAMGTNDLGIEMLNWGYEGVKVVTGQSHGRLVERRKLARTRSKHAGPLPAHRLGQKPAAVAETMHALKTAGAKRRPVTARASLPSSYFVPIDAWMGPHEDGVPSANGDNGLAEAAFAATAALEVSSVYAGGADVNLSQQQILSAAADCQSAFGFPVDYGLVTESRMPYRPQAGSTVDGRTLAPDVRAADFAIVVDEGGYDEVGLKRAILDYGPIVTYMNIFPDYDAFLDSDESYEGVYRHTRQNGEEPWPIPVLLVGWDDQARCWDIVDPWVEDVWGWVSVDKGRNDLEVGAVGAIAYEGVATVASRGAASGAALGTGTNGVSSGQANLGKAGGRAARLLQRKALARPQTKRTSPPVPRELAKKPGAVEQMMRGLQAGGAKQAPANTRTVFPAAYWVDTGDWCHPHDNVSASSTRDQAVEAAAFAAAAATEASLGYSGGSDMNLSEEQILSAATNSKSAFRFPVDYGLVTEERMPYRPQGGSTVDGRTLAPQVRAADVAMVGEINTYDEAAVKNALMNCGPVVAYMTVYDDYYAEFMSREDLWDGSIYRHADRQAKLEGQIPVLLIGWDDEWEDAAGVRAVWDLYDPWYGNEPYQFAERGQNDLGIGKWNFVYEGVALTGQQGAGNAGGSPARWAQRKKIAGAPSLRAGPVPKHTRGQKPAAVAELMRVLATKGVKQAAVRTRSALPRQYDVPFGDSGWDPHDYGLRPANGDWVQAEAAFAAAAATEASLVYAGGPDINLSQQQIISGSSGYVAAFVFPRDYGLVRETRMYYRPQETPTVDGRTLAPDVRAGDVSFVGNQGVCDEATLKRAIMDYGPVVTYMDIYSDYEAFLDGEDWVYRPVPPNGEEPWAIPILVVGWDDDDGSWTIVDPWIAGWDDVCGWRGAAKGQKALGIGTWTIVYTGVTLVDQRNAAPSGAESADGKKNVSATPAKGMQHR